MKAVTLVRLVTLLKMLRGDKMKAVLLVKLVTLVDLMRGNSK